MEHETKKIETILVERISTEGTQARAVLSEAIITEYADALVRGEEFPPIEVYFDDRTYWLADGFHRLGATCLARRSTIEAVVHQGGRREALLHAVGANETHGLRRTAADRRHAVLLLFDDPEWRLWSNNEIARQCRVSESFVRTLRREHAPKTPAGSPAPARKVQRGGKTYTMQTGRIGKVGTVRPVVGTGQGTAAAAPAPQEPAQRVHRVILPPATELERTAEAEHSALEELQVAATPATPEPAKVIPLPVHTEALQEPEEQPSSFETKIETHTGTEAPRDLDASATGVQQDTSPAPIVVPEGADTDHADVVMGNVEIAVSDEPLKPSSLVQAWDMATDEQRHAFVVAYRQALLGMLGYQEPEQSAGTSSKTPPRKPSTTTRRKGKSDGRST